MSNERWAPGTEPGKRAGREAGEAPPRTVMLLGVPLHDVTCNEVLDRMSRSLSDGRGGWILTPNLAILQRLVQSSEYRSLCDRATLRVPDGMPLIWASRLRGTPLRERVAGSDMIWHVCERAAAEGWSVYLLGGNPGAADAAAKRLAECYPGLRIAGTDCPPFGFESDEAYMAALRERLREAAPDICFVALSGDKQDRLINILRDDLPRTWFLGIGITFSFVCGEVRRAPRWMQKTGLEWAHRLVQEPRRLARRYLVDGVPFAGRLLLTSSWERIGATGNIPGGVPGREAERAHVRRERARYERIIIRDAERPGRDTMSDDVDAEMRIAVNPGRR